MDQSEIAPLLLPRPSSSSPKQPPGQQTERHGGAGGYGGSPSTVAEAPLIKTYLTRFWVLAVFSLMSCFQCLMWNTWGPLSESMGAAFPGWGSDTVAMMANWGTITFVVFVAPMCWLMNTQGLRVGALACGLLLGGGTVLRVLPFFTSSTTFFTVMCHVCAIMVGTAGTLVMAAPPLLAAEWFPPNERTTATALCQVMNGVGNSASYLEPLLVRSPSPSTTAADIREDVKHLMFLWAGVGLVLLLVVVLYFPACPPCPPSVASQHTRLGFRDSVNSLLSKRGVVLVGLTYGLCVGMPDVWGSVMVFSLLDLGMHQDDAMWVGLSSTFVSGVASLLMGRLTDLVYGHVKLTLILLMSGSAVCFFWFFLLTWGSIPVARWQIYASVIGALSFNSATSPLFMELGVESAFPCSEVVVGGFTTGAINFFGLILLSIFFIPNIGYAWVTYLLVASSGLSLLTLMLVPEDYTRSTLDGHYHL